MIREALGAAVVVLFCAGFGSGDGDYELFVRGVPYACSKSEKVCTEARIAIRENRHPDVPRDSVTECRAAPSCFSPESNAIKGGR